MKFETSNGLFIYIINNNCMLINDKGVTISFSDEYAEFNISSSMWFFKSDENWELKSTIPDKSMVVAFNTYSPSIRVIGFYNAVDDCLFDSEGDRYGEKYDNYEIVDINNITDFFPTLKNK